MPFFRTQTLVRLNRYTKHWIHHPFFFSSISPSHRQWWSHQRHIVDFLLALERTRQIDSSHINQLHWSNPSASTLNSSQFLNNYSIKSMLNSSLKLNASFIYCKAYYMTKPISLKFYETHSSCNFLKVEFHLQSFHWTHDIVWILYGDIWYDMIFITFKCNLVYHFLEDCLTQ